MIELCTRFSVAFTLAAVVGCGVLSLLGASESYVNQCKDRTIPALIVSLAALIVM